MNNAKIEVSRELAERLAKAIAIFTDHDSGVKLRHEYGVHWWNPLNADRDELRALLTTPSCSACNGCTDGCRLDRESPPSAQLQGEPVYQIRTHGSCCWEDISGESLEFCRAQADEYKIRTLYRHPAEQTRPAKLIYPDVSTWPEWANWIGLDATGYWVFYENKPETTEVGRILQGGKWGSPRFAEPQRGWAEMLYDRPVRLVRS